MGIMSGLAVVLVAAVFQGSFMVPMAYTKGWKWENSWAVFSLLGMLVFNWAIALKYFDLGHFGQTIQASLVPML